MTHHSKIGLLSRVIHGYSEPDPLFGAVSVPIYQSSTFAFRSAEHGAALFAGEERGYIYTRLGNPTVQALEECLASLENGVACLATASGMAAITTTFLALLEKNTHLLSTASVYGATRIVVEKEFSRFGVRSTFIDTSDIEAVRRHWQPETRILFIETPANPTMAITDIQACAHLAHEHGCWLVVDNTFASPILQNPLALGADIVIHSLTKFINGHSDVVGGAIIFRDDNLYSHVRKTQINLGGTMDPHQAWLILRGLKTLALRVEKSQENAQKLARFLQNHPLVSWVKYPGLENHPQHGLAQRQMRGPGSMLCFGLKGGYEAGRRLINSVQLCTLAVSLGGLETLIQHPASMTHAAVPKKEREDSGITDDLIRLSVGCEDYEDLQADLSQALEKTTI